MNLYLFLIPAVHGYVHRRRTCLVSVQGTLVTGDEKMGCGISL
jgi:hypothetical protein